MTVVLCFAAFLALLVVADLLPSEAECRAGVVAPRVSDATALGIGSP